MKFNWGKCPLATASFGHGITTTLIQVVKAYSIIVNGGYNIKPSLLKHIKKLKKEKLLELNPHSKDQRKVYGNNNLLKSIGWSVEHEIDSWLDDLINFYLNE